MSLGSHFRIRGTTPYYNAIRHLGFPTLRTIAIYLVGLSIGGPTIAYFLISPAAEGLWSGAMAGLIIIALPTFLADFLVNDRIMRGDSLFYRRRILALSLFSVGVWIVGMFVGVPLKLVFGNLLRYPEHMLYVATFVVVTFRMIAALSMSDRRMPTRITFAVSQPAVVLAAAGLYWAIPWTRIATVLASSTLIGFTFCSVLLAHVERRGTQEIGFSPLKLFRAFLLDLLNGENAALENYLSQLGQDSEVSLTAIGFKESSGEKWKGVIVSPDIHPGPFLNVGSSALPFLIQAIIERETGSPTLVTHGVSGHELNLVSQEDNVKVLSELRRLIKFKRFERKATPFIRRESGTAKASCQIFNKTALVTMTTAPDDMEDIPLQTGVAFRKELNSLFENVALVDAHNCLSQPTVMNDEKILSLVEAAQTAVKDASSFKRSEFRVGFASGRPDGWSLMDGLGPAGIAACVTEIEGVRTAYLSFDGNNMAPGFREGILNELKMLGFEDGEILTTDSHIVNGVTHAKLGYRVVGEVDPRELTAAALRTTKEAIANLSEARVAAATGTVRVRTLGETAFSNVTRLIHEISQLTALTLFPTVLLVALLTLLVLV